jgi:DNA-binding NtrC family response regulator
MQMSNTTLRPMILLLGQDARLVQTRGWVLEKSGFRVCTTLILDEIKELAERETVDLFLLCDSLLPKSRTQALAIIHTYWPHAKRIVLTATGSSGEFEFADVVFPAAEGPRKLVAMIHNLMTNEPVPQQ